MEKTKKVLIVAGEASGDLHAANLVEAVNEKLPNVEWFGLGGKRMLKKGVRIIADPTGLAVVGFWEVVKNIFYYKKIFKKILWHCAQEKPDLAILVDYPGFNLHLSKVLKQRGIPVLYYISPQIWAWAPQRIKTIKETVTHMLVFFDFEEELYRKAKVKVTWVGHPLVETTKLTRNTKEIFQELKLSPEKLTICLLPGSRAKEVKVLLPLMLECARIIKESVDNIQFVLAKSSTVEEKVYLRYCQALNLSLAEVYDNTVEALAVSDVALVCSGTATLETALMQVPMVIVYKVSFLTWIFARLFIRIPYIGLVNVVYGAKLIPEFLQSNARAFTIANVIIKLLEDKKQRERIREILSTIRQKLGPSGATLRAADIVIRYLEEKSS
ncbi:MAG: lipid-A-disaccharide synthase [Candidatus Omnitrophica bacterium]|nr:lipid-A-disaccharide synthase [Candidatus Omnitrophota bacterium]